MLTRRTIVAGFVAVIAASIAFANPVSRSIYPAPTDLLALDGLPAGSRFVAVTTVDGLALKGIVVAPRTGMPLVLVFHGNASSASGTVRWFAPLIARGYGVLAAEYRGYAGLPGTPSEIGLGHDADAFATFARTEVKGTPLWLVGHSLGGGVALNLAMRTRFDLVATIGTFTRIRDMAPGIARALVPDAYRNMTNVPRLRDPYILIHGTKDEVVPAGMGNALHNAASKAKLNGASFVMIDTGHQPEAEKLLAIFETGRAWRGTSKWDTTALPRDVKLVPFGQGNPLNP